MLHRARRAFPAATVLFALAAAAPQSAYAARDGVTVTVDWNNPEGAASRFSYGLNAYSGMVPSIAQVPGYGENLAYMRPGLIRYHYGNLVRQSRTDVRSWVHPTERRWDADKIGEALDAAKAWENQHGYKPTILITIPNWPSWMKTYSLDVRQPNGATRTVRGFLDPSEYDNFAAFCAELVRIVNLKQGRGITYFEITNERDNIYYAEFDRAGVPSQNRMSELVEIYNRAAQAMKAVDPSIRVGGLAFARPDLTASVQTFLRGTVQNVNFLSIHGYATGDKTKSDEFIYDKTEELGSTAAAVVGIAKAESPLRRIPVHLNEYNISWTSTNNDPRMQNHKGGVFDALAMIRALEAGVYATNAWNERDGVYGKMSATYQLRPSAHVFNLFNRFMFGVRYAATTSDAASVVPLAISAETHKAIALVNRSNEAQRIDLESARGNQGLNGSSSFTLHRLDADGLSRRTIRWGEIEAGRLTLPAHSVSVLVADSRTP